MFILNEDDLRDCFAMFKAMTGASPQVCYMFAEEMLQARKKKYWVEPEPEDDGIATVAKRTYKRRTK